MFEPIEIDQQNRNFIYNSEMTDKWDKFGRKRIKNNVSVLSWWAASRCSKSVSKLISRIQLLVLFGFISATFI